MCYVLFDVSVCLNAKNSYWARCVDCKCVLYYGEIHQGVDGLFKASVLHL